MKRRIAIFLVCAFCVSLSACTESVRISEISSTKSQSEALISETLLSRDVESRVWTSVSDESNTDFSEGSSSKPIDSISGAVNNSSSNKLQNSSSSELKENSHTESKTEIAVESVTSAQDEEEYTLSDMEQQIFDLVNKERLEAGLSQYRLDLNIYELAKIRATEAADTWSHTRPDGRQFHSVFIDHEIYDYSAIGENLGRKFTTAEQIVEALMNSEGHRANILSEEFDVVCIAVYTTEDGTNCLCQLFCKTR